MHHEAIVNSTTSSPMKEKLGTAAKTIAAAGPIVIPIAEQATNNAETLVFQVSGIKLAIYFLARTLPPPKPIRNLPKIRSPILLKGQAIAQKKFPDAIHISAKKYDLVQVN